MREVIGFIFALVFLTIACHDNCQTYKERCTANVAEICAGDKDWQEMMNCDEIQPAGWVCCEFESGDAGVVASCASSAEECERWNQ